MVLPTIMHHLSLELFTEYNIHKGEGMDILYQIIQMISTIAGLAATLIVIIKPLRNKVLGTVEIQNGQRCLLRSEMLAIYYKHRDTCVIRQYECENFLYLYSAYKALGGNSFVDKIKKEVDSWEVVS